jgi:hypothetical protein
VARHSEAHVDDGCRKNLTWNTASTAPFFRVPKANETKFKTLVREGFYPLVAAEPLCLYYNFTFGEQDGVMIAHCREAYEGAEGLLAHLANVQEPLGEANELGELFKAEVHGPQAELDKLYEPLAGLSPTYFVQL